MCMSLCLSVSLSLAGVYERAWRRVSFSCTIIKKTKFGRVIGTQATCCRDRRPVDELIQAAGTYNPRGGGGGEEGGGRRPDPSPPPPPSPPPFAFPRVYYYTVILLNKRSEVQTCFLLLLIFVELQRGVICLGGI